MTRQLAVVVLAFSVPWWTPAPAGAQDLEIGVFVGTSDGPQEVAVYAERLRDGRLRMARGTLDDVQTVQGLVEFVCNLPRWRLRSVFLSTGRLLLDQPAKRRTLAATIRRFSLFGVFVSVPASAEPERWRNLLDEVGASEDNPAYVFVTMESGGLLRDFIVGVETDR